MKHMGPKVSEVPSVWSIQRFLDAQPCEKLRRRNSKLQTKFLKAPDVFPPSLPLLLLSPSHPHSPISFKHGVCTEQSQKNSGKQISLNIHL